MKSARLHLVGRKDAGFTLVELLIAVTIIGILAALSLAGLSRARASAMNTKAMNNLRQLMLADTLYAGDNDNQYDMVYNDSPPMTWGQRLFPYLGIPPTGAIGVMQMDPTSVFNVPESKPSSQRALYARSIAMNGFIRNTANPAWNYRTIAVTRPAEVLMFVEIQERNTEFISIYTAGVANGLAFRGGGGTKCRVGFCDGHADALTAQQLSYDAGAGQIISTGNTPPWGF